MKTNSGIRVLIGVFGVAAGGVCSAQQTASWLNPVDGLWSDAANWSGGVVPDNSGGNTFIAEILVPGAYRVTVDTDISLSGLSVAAPGSSLLLDASDRRFESVGSNLLDGVDVMGTGGSTVDLGGNTVMQGGGRVANVSRFTFSGTSNFTGNDDFDLCDTCVFIRGDGNWSGGAGFTLEGVNGSSEIVVEQGGNLSLTGGGDRRIRGVGVLNRFVNRGTLSVNLDDPSSMMDIDSAMLLNTEGALVDVTSGMLRSNAFGSAILGRLEGGDWSVKNAGTVDLLGVNVRETAVRVELSGAGSSFGAIDSLQKVLATGAFAVRDGRDFVTDATATEFEVRGELEVGAGSTFTVSSMLANIQSGALRRGRFVVGGTLEVDAGGISTLGADLVLRGAGSIVDASGGGDLLADLSDIDSDGTLELASGAVFSTAGDLSLTGALKIGSGSAMTINGDLSAFQGGVFGGATIELGGDVTADNAALERVEGRFTVGRDGRLLVSDAGGTIDGLAFLRRIESGGTFGLTGGRVLDLTPTDNTVEIAGTLVLGSSSGSGAGSALMADGVAIETGGEVRIEIASLGDFGRIETAAAAFGGGAPGETAGVLTLVLGEGYSATLGDEFSVVALTPGGVINGAGFDSIAVNGVLGGGLFFEQFIDADGLGVRLVPTPGVGGVMMLGLLASRRRRGAKPSVAV